MSVKVVPRGRRTARIRCNIRGTLRFLGQVYNVRVIDISHLGMAVEMTDWISARPGSIVHIQTSEFGAIEGTVRWYRSRKIGLQIEETSKTAAQIAAYFKNHHRLVG